MGRVSRSLCGVVGPVVPQDTLKARAQSAKSAKAVQEMASGMSTSNALAAFDRMEEKVRARLSPSLSHTTLSHFSLSHTRPYSAMLSVRRPSANDPLFSFGPMPRGPRTAAVGRTSEGSFTD